MNTAKRLLTLLIAAIMLLSVCPLSALADSIAEYKAAKGIEEINAAIAQSSKTENLPASGTQDLPAGKTAPQTATQREIKAAKSFAGGTGTQSDPYQIENAEQLAFMRDQVNSGNDNYDGKFIKLTADIDLSGTEWTPIGYLYDLDNYTRTFQGTFDGDGHVVSNFMITSYSLSAYKRSAYVGLFGYCYNGRIQNVAAESFTIKLYWSIHIYVGGLVGYNTGGAITNCYATGTVSATSSGYQPASICAGGLVGYNDNTDDTIENCYATGTVSAKSMSEYAYAGGLVGSSNLSTIITNCYATGDVSAITSEFQVSAYAGGLVGENSAAITNSYATGEVSATSSCRDTYTYAGGLVGHTDGTITNCHATGTVSATNSLTYVYDPFQYPYVYVYAGGLAGNSSNCTIINCYATGDVSATSSEPIADTYAGGLVGYNSSNIINKNTIENCYATGDILATDIGDLFAGGLVGYSYNSVTITNCYATGDVSAAACSTKAYAGGLVGEAYDCTISNCYATGDVSASTSNDYAYAGGLVGEGVDPTNCYATGNVSASSLKGEGRAYAGGLVGIINTEAITNCYATGDVSVMSSSYAHAGGLVGENRSRNSTITNCYATGDVSATTSYTSVYAGGLVGFNESDSDTITNCYATGTVSATSASEYAYAGGLVGYKYRDSGTITNCYATGDVSATSASEYAYAGGLIGNNYGTITNCYRYSGQIIMINETFEASNDLGTPLTDPQMRIAECFEGFDFDTIWTMEGNEEYFYPELQAVEHFNGTPRYDAVFMSDGGIIAIVSTPIGSTPVPPQNPTSDGSCVEFSHWTPELMPMTPEGAVYKAVFKYAYGNSSAYAAKQIIDYDMSLQVDARLFNQKYSYDFAAESLSTKYGINALMSAYLGVADKEYRERPELMYELMLFDVLGRSTSTLDVDPMQKACDDAIKLTVSQITKIYGYKPGASTDLCDFDEIWDVCCSSFADVSFKTNTLYDVYKTADSLESFVSAVNRAYIAKSYTKETTKLLTRTYNSISGTDNTASYLRKALSNVIGYYKSDIDNVYFRNLNAKLDDIMLDAMTTLAKTFIKCTPLGPVVEAISFSFDAGLLISNFAFATEEICKYRLMMMAYGQLSEAFGAVGNECESNFLAGNNADAAMFKAAYDLRLNIMEYGTKLTYKLYSTELTGGIFNEVIQTLVAKLGGTDLDTNGILASLQEGVNNAKSNAKSYRALFSKFEEAYYSVEGTELPTDNRIAAIFIGNAQSIPPTVTLLEPGERLSPRSVSLSGHRFVYWASDKELENEFNFSLPIEKDCILYAKWEYILIYEKRGDVLVITGVASKKSLKDIERITVPIAIDGCIVTGIEDGAFQGFSGEMYIASSVTDFGENIFDNDVTIYCLENTPAYDYAVSNSYECNTVSNSSTPYTAYHTVTFIDGLSGETIKTAQVKHGADATPPTPPIHDGYTFTGWSHDGKNITADTTITARYAIKTYTVTYVDGLTGETLGTETVNHGSDATMWNQPTHEGYTFTGWDHDGKNITADTTIRAQYAIITCTVTFVDWDCSVIDTQTVNYGKDAEAPADPTRVGYTFTGWDKAFTSVAEDLTVTAQYTINKYTVTFIDSFTDEIISTQTVEYGADVTPPAPPVHESYDFIGWSQDGKNITEDTTITAQYELTLELGDVNCDGEVNTGDAVLILKASVGAAQLSNTQRKAADYNNDGEVNTGDAVAVLKYCVGGGETSVKYAIVTRKND